MNDQYYIYIMSNKWNTVLYAGVTNDIIRRVYEHKHSSENNVKTKSSFSGKYNVTKLVYFETFSDIENAILREKQIKAGSRNKKMKLVNTLNPEWKDLYDGLLR